MNRYFSLFYKRSRRFYIVLTFIGIVNSALNSAFMIIVSKSISNAEFFVFKGHYPLYFFSLFIACIILNMLFYSYMIRLSSSIVNEIEMGIIQKIKISSF